MAILNRQQILEAPDLRTETVPVPEWGGEVIVIGLSGTERDEFERSVVEQKGKKTSLNLTNIRAKLCAKCIVDENHERIFSDQDIAALGSKSGSALQRVFEVAQRLSGLRDEDIDELEKNSESDPNDSSTSA